MDQMDKVPCVQVNSTNIDACWPFISKAIEQSHFVAIDLELSGLGNKKKLILKDIEDRYKAIGNAAKTRSILSVGLSFFRYYRSELENMSEENMLGCETDEWNFNVINFELSTLCKEDSVLEDESRDFLVSHGFDFEAQTTTGLHYLRGDQELFPDLPSIRNLFYQLANKKVPLVLHNGLLDIIFMYQSFFAELPDKLTSFVADLNQLFPKGIFDTKYIAEHILTPKSSYLEYLFYQRQRHNLESKVANKPFISINFTVDDLIRCFAVEKSMASIILGEKPEGLTICDDYRNYGWCKDGSSCQKSHDIDFILDDEEIYKNPSKRRKRILIKASSINSPKTDSDPNKTNDQSDIKEHINGQVKSAIHCSGYDAFMTGYCFATFINQLAKQKPGKSGKINFSTSELRMINNRIYLQRSKEPLQIRYSPYSKPSNILIKLVTGLNIKEEAEERANEMNLNRANESTESSSSSSNASEESASLNLSDNGGNLVPNSNQLSIAN